MESKKYKIIHWDDDEIMKSFVDGTVRTILEDFNCVVEKSEFCDLPKSYIELVKSEKYDFIILDISDESNDIGFELLNETISIYKNKIPFLIFSRHPRVLEKIEEFKKENDLNIIFLDKGKRGDPRYHQIVKEKLKLLLNLTFSNIKLTTENDFQTQSAVNTVGFQNLQTIISEYLNYKNLIKRDNVNLRSIAPGYSGAYVLELQFESVSKLLKISHDKSAILEEYKNLEYFSTFLPSPLKVDYERINPNDLSCEGWYSIIYEFASYSTTLFNFLLKNQDEEKINKILSNLFSDGKLFKLYCQEEISDSITENILGDLNSTRAMYIKNSIKVLSPILHKYSKLFDNDVIDSIIEKHFYKNISKEKIGKPSSTKILSHGDLHSNNILINSEEFPIIIDPGNINYKHWSFDISRLLVDIFIRGFEFNSLQYFDIKSIKKDFLISDRIMLRNPIKLDTENLSNNGFVIAINWITRNIEKLFGKYFSEWEFQLGLGVEFLRTSYKSQSLPPNKRVVALLAACEAIRKANKSLKNALIDN